MKKIQALLFLLIGYIVTVCNRIASVFTVWRRNDEIMTFMNPHKPKFLVIREFFATFVIILTIALLIFGKTNAAMWVYLVNVFLIIMRDFFAQIKTT